MIALTLPGTLIRVQAVPLWLLPLSSVCLFLAFVSLAVGAGYLVFIGAGRPGYPAKIVLFRIAVAAAWCAPAVLRGGTRPLVEVVLGSIAALAAMTCFRDFVPPSTSDAISIPIGTVALSAAAHAGLVAWVAGGFRIGSFLTAGAVAGLLILALNDGGFGTGRMRNPSVARVGGQLLVALAIMAFVMVERRSPQLLAANGNAGMGSGRGPGRAAGSGGQHSGVVLLPEVKSRVTMLVQPGRHAASAVHPMKDRDSAGRDRDDIMFTGEYWFFYSVSRLVDGVLVYARSRPPDSAQVEHGDPLLWTMTTMDSRMPLVMKAHQKLAAPIPLPCCRGIALDLINGEEWATEGQKEPVYLEMALWDSRTVREQSLGKVLVPAWPKEPTVRFAFPARLSLRQFDAIDVTFHLPASRRNKSAHLAIRRFEIQRSRAIGSGG